jgi:hypothetical protein
MTWDVNVWAILTATVAYFVLGAAWYGVLGSAWLAALGRTREQMGAGDAGPIIFILAFVLEAVAVFTLAVLIANAATTGALGGAAIGALVGIGIWCALLTVTFMYEQRRPALFLIDGGYHLVALTLAGAILGAWR